MSSSYDYLTSIIDPSTPPTRLAASLRGFAEGLNWLPSYEISNNFGVPNAEHHLVVEHGLENAAVISFLQSPIRSSELDSQQLQRLLALSYNNLVDWHFFVSSSEATLVNNRTSPHQEILFPISRRDLTPLSGESIETAFSNMSLRESIPSCDQNLIRTISRWKRLLTSDFRGKIDNSNISTLFNGLIFLRGYEDFLGLGKLDSDRLLVDLANEQEKTAVNVSNLLSMALKALRVNEPLTRLVDGKKLDVFKEFDRASFAQLASELYRTSSAPYDFNFALMSKHALSRIYESYVSILDFDEDEPRQYSFVGQLPTERDATKHGSIYTPQFIASFFARFVRDNVTPLAFRSLKAIDPACGSGIFLRALLELQCNPLSPSFTPDTIRTSFRNISAFDQDPNACEATRLSLTLLYLDALGKLPTKIDINLDDSIKLAHDGKFKRKKYGAVIANPPYRQLESLSPDERKVYSEYLKELSAPRIDSYLAFIKLSLDIVEDGGLVCLVLPQTFLFAKNAQSLRKRIADEFHVRCLVDLSALSVFEQVGVYTILLVLQRPVGRTTDEPAAQIVICTDFVGAALQAALDYREVETPYYSVSSAAQNEFAQNEWVILSPSDRLLDRRISTHPSLSSFLEVKQGFISGNDDVFILPRELVPARERNLYLKYLPDREIFRYRLPKRLGKLFFYPYVDDQIISEETLRKNYPYTWKHLCGHRAALEKRGSVKRGDHPWWRPSWPRDPKNLLRPKIVCPHLMLTPRFGLDLKGELAVSHAPFLAAKMDEESDTALKYFCAILNSSVCQWYMSRHSYKYSKGYNRLEVATVKPVPVPDPALTPKEHFRKIIRLVDESLATGVESDIDLQLDELVADLYGLTERERELLVGKY